jgi:YgiT-type zinc finger domain-containing protein
MKCAVCGAQLQSVPSDLPFKVSEQTIVILKQLPVWQCENCAQYLLEDRVLRRVDEILAGVDRAAELEIIRFAA